MDGDPELLLYGITAATQPHPENLEGVCGARLHAITESGLSALVSSVPPREGLSKPQVDDLLTFQRAIAAVHAAGDVLPARFGCVLGSEAELRTHLRERQQVYQESLARIANCVELAVRIQFPPEKADPAKVPSKPLPTGGADYLRARQAHHARLQLDEERVQRSSAELQEIYADLVKESVTTKSGAGPDGSAITVSFLVARSHLEAFKARFAARQNNAAPRQFLLGPWPPFSFSGESGVHVIEDRTRAV